MTLFHDNNNSVLFVLLYRWLRLIVDEGHEIGQNKHLIKEFSMSSSAAHRGTLPEIVKNDSSQKSDDKKSKNKKNSRRKSQLSNVETFAPSTIFICSLAAERRYVCVCMCVCVCGGGCGEVCERENVCGWLFRRYLCMFVYECVCMY